MYFHKQGFTVIFKMLNKVHIKVYNYMTTNFKNYDNNICFLSFYLFLLTKYQHKSKLKNFP